MGRSDSDSLNKAFKDGVKDGIGLIKDTADFIKDTTEKIVRGGKDNEESDKDKKDD